MTARVALGTEPEGEPEGEGSKFGRELARVVRGRARIARTTQFAGASSASPPRERPRCSGLVNVRVRLALPARATLSARR